MCVEWCFKAECKSYLHICGGCHQRNTNNLTLKMCQTAELSNGTPEICYITNFSAPEMCYITIFGTPAAPEQSSTNYTAVPVFQFKHAFIDTSFKIRPSFLPLVTPETTPGTHFVPLHLVFTAFLHSRSRRKVLNCAVWKMFSSSSVGSMKNETAITYQFSPQKHSFCANWYWFHSLG